VACSSPVYQTHPYQWNTIGKEISHIENAVMDDAGLFSAKYAPQNIGSGRKAVSELTCGARFSSVLADLAVWPFSANRLPSLPSRPCATQHLAPVP
jgi:hypothetical protein